ncbi:MAG: phage tail tape measure protein [Acidobacterium ailaaui]|nr:phage tail tape measure protein [Pseudacidobacterium ailaaui]
MSEVNRFNSAIQQSGKSTGSFGNNGRNALNGIKNAAVETAARLGIVATAAAGVGVAFSGIKKTMDFEAELSTIKALTGASSAEMQKMSNLAIQMGAKTKYSALEAAQGIEELLKAGLTPAQVQAGGLESALNLATAGGLNLADAAEIMSTALNSFKDDELKASDAANILAGTANASATDVQDLRYSLSQVSAVAAGVGMSFRDTNIALGLFANRGLKGSDAGTSLKTMLANLQPQTKAQTAAFLELGLMTEDGANKFFDASGKLKSLKDIAGILHDKLKNLTNQQRMSALQTIFGSDAIRAATILYKEGADGVQKFNKEMSKVTALDVAREKMNNASGAVEQFKGAMETLQIAVLMPLMPIIKDAANSMANFVGNLKPEQIQNFADTVKNAFQTAWNIVSSFAHFIITNWPVIRETVIGLGTAFITFKGIMAGLTIIGTITRLIEAWRTGTLAMTAAQMGLNIAMLMNPVGLVVAGIAALVAVGVLLYRNWDTIKAKASELWAKITSVFGAMKDWVVQKFTAIVTGAQQWFENLRQTIANKVSSAVSTATTFISQLPGKIAYWLGYMVGLATTWISQLPGRFSRFFSSAYNNAVNWVSKLPGRIGSFLSSMYSRAVSRLQSTASSFGKWFRNAYDNAAKAISGLPGKIGSILASIPKKVMGAIGSIRKAFSNLGSEAVSAFNSAISGIGSLGGKFMSGFRAGKKSAKGHYHGIDRIPYDQYPALLHKDERVLTAKEADEYDRMQAAQTASATPVVIDRNPAPASISITIPKIADYFVVREEADIDKITDQLAVKIKAAWEAGA